MIVLVTGYAGSGTSRVAEYLHRHGLPMALVIKPPKPGTDLYMSWTDAIYQEAAQGELDLNPTDPQTSLIQRNNIVQHKMLRLNNHGNHWGLKSPLLLLNLPMWLAECRAITDTKLVLTDRPFDECQDSVRRHGAHPLLHAKRDQGLRINERLRYGYGLCQPDIVVKFGANLDDIFKGIL